MSTPTLHKYLATKLDQKRKNHPSFKLMKIDNNLFPKGMINLETEAQVSSNDIKTVKEIIGESWNKKEKNHLMIEGEGGIGKTVTLLSIPDKFTPFPIPAIYIPLHELDEFITDHDPIASYIQRWVLNNKEDLFGQLLDLIEQPWDNGPQLLLLLDGFNEIAADDHDQKIIRKTKREIISNNIGHWSEYPGIQIVTSSRFDIQTYVALSYEYSAIRLRPLSYKTLETYLNGAGIPIPVNDAVKKLITIPLLLTLYIKTELVLKQRKTDSSDFRVVKNAGTIVWNYLQCELWRFGKEEENAKNAIITMEFIAPYIAWEMQQNSWYHLNKEQFKSLLDNAYKFLGEHFNKPADFSFHIQEALQKAGGMPTLELLRRLLEKHLCLFIKTGEQYRLMHQQFRDALAAIHLINLSYTSGKSLHSEWRDNIIDYYVIQFVADLINEEDASRLWEQNKNTIPRVENATRNQLELQRRYNNSNFSELDFSGLDLSNISLYPYRISGAKVKLPSKWEKMNNTIVSEKTFSASGHQDVVNAVALTSNGRYIISGSDDKTVCVWDFISGECIQTLYGHSGHVRAIAVMPDDTIISGSADGTIRIWSIENGEYKNRKELTKRHKKPVNAIAVSNDGHTIVSGSSDNTLCIWDINSNYPIKTLTEHSNSIKTVAISPNGNYILSGSTDNTIRVWNFIDDHSLYTPLSHDSHITAVCITQDNKYIISGGWDKWIKIWDLENGNLIKALKRRHQNRVQFIVTRNERHFITGGEDNSIRIWNLESLNYIKVLCKHEKPVNAAATSQNGRYIISGSDDNTLRIWDIENGSQIKTLASGEIAIIAVAITPDNKYIIAASNDYKIRIWNFDNGDYIKTIKTHNRKIKAISTLDGKHILCNLEDKTTCIWNLDGGEIATDFEPSCYKTQKGKLFVGLSSNDTIVVYNRETREPIHTFVGHENTVNATAITPDEKYLISGSKDKTIRIWNIQTGLYNVIDLQASVNTIAVDENSNYIVCGTSNGTIYITDINTPKVRTTIHILPISVDGLDFSKAIISTPELKETLRQNGAKV